MKLIRSLSNSKAKNQIAEKLGKLLKKEINRMIKDSNKISEPYGIKIVTVPIGKIEIDIG